MQNLWNCRTIYKCLFSTVYLCISILTHPVWEPKKSFSNIFLMHILSNKTLFVRHKSFPRGIKYWIFSDTQHPPWGGFMCCQIIHTLTLRKWSAQKTSGCGTIQRLIGKRESKDFLKRGMEESKKGRLFAEKVGYKYPLRTLNIWLK